MPDRAAIFIDGAYLEYTVRDEFGGVPLNFQTLASTMAKGTEILRRWQVGA